MLLLGALYALYVASTPYNIQSHVLAAGLGLLTSFQERNQVKLSAAWPFKGMDEYKAFSG